MPIRLGDQVIGVIDIDCEVTHGFDEVDRQHLESLAQVLADACDWDI